MKNRSKSRGQLEVRAGRMHPRLFLSPRQDWCSRSVALHYYVTARKRLNKEPERGLPAPNGWPSDP